MSKRKICSFIKKVLLQRRAESETHPSVGGFAMISFTGGTGCAIVTQNLNVQKHASFTSYKAGKYTVIDN